MPSQTWTEILAEMNSDATAYHTSTTESLIAPVMSVPANYMKGSRLLKLTAFGKLSTTATPTMTWALRWGGAAGTLLATTEAITMGSGVANVNWRLEAFIQTRSNGAAGTLLVWGTLHVHTAAGTVLQNVFSVSGYDAPAVSAAVDLTAQADLALTGDWSASSASNTLTTMALLLEGLN
jgi:hypothetical protein